MRYIELKSPVTAQFELTYRCTNQCVYCYNSSRGKIQFAEPELDINRALEVSKKLADAEVFEVVLTGGEPLARRDLLYSCAQYLSSQNIDVKLNTNLLCLKEEDCKKIKGSGVVSVFASLCSYDCQTYNQVTKTRGFDKAVEGINLLLNNDISIGINMVVIKNNKDQVFETGKFLHKLGVKYFCATPASPCQFLESKLELEKDEIIKSLDDLIRLRDEFGMVVDIVEPLPRCLVLNGEKYEQFLRRDCAAGKLTVAVSPFGKVRPCTHVPVEYGSLLDEEMSTIWKRMKPWRDGSQVPDKCNSCSLLDVCSLGCREAAKIKTKSYNGFDPWATRSISEKRDSFIEVQVEDGKTMRMMKGIKFREEQEGYLIFAPKTHSVVYANKDLFGAMKILSRTGDFSINLLRKAHGEDMVSIAKYLKFKELIE